MPMMKPLTISYDRPHSKIVLSSIVNDKRRAMCSFDILTVKLLLLVELWHLVGKCGENLL